MNYSAVLLAFVASLSYSWAGEANANKFLRLPTQPEAVENASGPLFLTPLIEANKMEEAKKLASVEPLLGSGRSYAGLLTVDKAYDSNLFFWFFPSERNPDTAPVVVWLAGIRTSSFPGVFAGVGPYRVIDNRTVELHKASWTKTVSVLFIDNPVGVGYSFTNSSQGYWNNEDDVGKNLYAGLVQFYALFPELSKNELYVAGESYGGKHAAACADEIHRRQLNVESPKMNLTGVMIFAGYCDPMRQLKYGDYLYQLGMVDARGRDAYKKRENAAVKFLQERNYVAAMRETAGIILSGGSDPSLFTKLTGLGDDGTLNIIRSRDSILNVVAQFVQTTFVRNAVHVGHLAFGARGVYHDSVMSVVPRIQTLIEKYKFLFVGGELDAIVPFPAWDDILANLEWRGAPQYRNARRKIWKVNGDVVGYVKSVNDSRMMLAWVRNAGHLVPMDQPADVYELMQKMVFDKPLDLTDVSE